MSERALITAFKEEAERARLGEKDNPVMTACPLWGDEKGAYARADKEAGGELVYTFRTDSVFRRDPATAPVAISEEQAASLASQIYFENNAGVIPHLEALKEAAADERPDHQARIDLFLLSIDIGDPDGAYGIEIAEPNPAYGHPEGEGEDPLDFHSRIRAATACNSDHELQQVLSEAEKEGFIESYIMDPPGDFLWAKLTRKGHAELPRIRRARSFGKRPSLEAALAAEQVTFILDTNILCEFKAPDQIPWTELAGHACEVRLVAPAGVAEEMDEHKRARGRLLKRALWFNNLQRRFEDNGDQPIELAEGPPRITFEIAPLRRKSELDGDWFELDDPDGRIVAEAVLFAEDELAAIFLADDGKSVRLSRNAGLLTQRLNNSWRREAPPDERDELIAELKEQLGARPQLTLQGDYCYMKDGVFRFQALADDSTPDALVKLITAKLLEKSPRATDNYLEGLLGRCGGSGLQIGGISEASIDRYREKYSVYEAAVADYANRFVERYAKTAFILPVRFVVGNDGTALATDVVLEAETRGPLEFLPETQAELHFGEAPKPPETPSPAVALSHASDPQLFGPPSLPDPFALRQQNFPALEGGTRALEWRCAQFRHGDACSPYAFIVGSEGDPVGGAVRLRLRAGNIAAPIETTIPVRAPVDEIALAEHHLRSAALMADDDAWHPVSDAIDAHINVTAEGAAEGEGA